MEATRRFALCVARPEGEIDLAEACLLIAAHVHRTLDVAAQLRRIDAIAVRCPPGFAGLRKYLFDDLAFTGNTEQYDDPANSYLNEVIDRRTGLPITLSILAMEVGKRTGVPLSGIGMPAHFVVRHDAEPRTYLDPFYGGELLDATGCRARFHDIVGADVPFDPTWLKPAAPLEIVARVLANLKDVFVARSQWANVEWVVRCRLSIPGTAPVERRQLAQAVAQQGRFHEAAHELELAAGVVTDEEERAALVSEAVTLRARLN